MSYAFPTQSEAAYYSRLGGLVIDKHDPEMRMSRAMQICRTWRSHFAWHLACALGWTTPTGAPR